MTTAVEVAEKGHQLAAWVNFNGTLAMTVGSSYGPDAPPADYSSPNPIRAAYNVASITDNGTGDYTVNFTTAMPDANYSAVGSTNNGGTIGGWYVLTPFVYSTGSVRIGTTAGSGTDNSLISVSIFR